MTELGFKEISIEPVVTPDENDYAIREEDLPTIFEQYDKLAVDLIRRQKEGKPVTFFHYKLDLMVVRVCTSVCLDVVPVRSIWQ